MTLDYFRHKHYFMLRLLCLNIKRNSFLSKLLIVLVAILKNIFLPLELSQHHFLFNKYILVTSMLVHVIQ